MNTEKYIISRILNPPASPFFFENDRFFTPEYKDRSDFVAVEFLFIIYLSPSWNSSHLFIHFVLFFVRRFIFLFFPMRLGAIVDILSRIRNSWSWFSTCLGFRRSWKDGKIQYISYSYRKAHDINHFLFLPLRELFHLNSGRNGREKISVAFQFIICIH